MSTTGMPVAGSVSVVKVPTSWLRLSVVVTPVWQTLHPAAPEKSCLPSCWRAVRVPSAARLGLSGARTARDWRKARMSSNWGPVRPAPPMRVWTICWNPWKSVISPAQWKGLVWARKPVASSGVFRGPSVNIQVRPSSRPSGWQEAQEMPPRRVSVRLGIGGGVEEPPAALDVGVSHAGAPVTETVRVTWSRWATSGTPGVRAISETV